MGIGDLEQVDRIPILPPTLGSELEAVEASIDREMKYVPCLVHLRSGETHSCVYVADAERYIRYWGVWPWEDDHKAYVSLEEVVAIEESPHRMPPQFPNKMYDAGESGMGYAVFSLLLRDGSRIEYTCGNAIDFVELPEGVSWNMVEDLVPHQGGRDGGALSCSDYAWCLYRRT